MESVVSHHMVQLLAVLQILFNCMYALYLGKMYFVGHIYFHDRRIW